MQRSHRDIPRNYDYVCIIIGYSGCGKSKLINALNCFFSNKQPGEIRQKAEVGMRAKSCTHNVIDYDFTYEGKSYLFIDTPGISDTSGDYNYQLNIKREILNRIASLDKITAVLQVFNESENKDQKELKISQELILNMFIRDIKRNIIGIITFSTEDEANDFFGCIDEDKSKSDFYRFTKVRVSECVTINNAFSYEVSYKARENKSWSEFCDEKLLKIIKVIKSLNPISTNEYKRLINLKSYINEKILEIDMRFSKINKIKKKIKEAIENPNSINKLKAESNFITSVEIEYEENYFGPDNLLCLIRDGCNVNHGNCVMDMGLISSLRQSWGEYFCTNCPQCKHPRVFHGIQNGYFTRKIYREPKVSLDEYISKLYRSLANAEDELKEAKVQTIDLFIKIREIIDINFQQLIDELAHLRKNMYLEFIEEVQNCIPN
ncbi:hypothetical protein SteCoe_1983 [Stentor coeruleus]|uniref:G domain-containing protein n=1 Tax=Stentor coeruleus TaxID=5963 RepID=A0A1R2D0P1_9CILI|nr:hypothetical protein SteCoe_1983 [Stentor coeruleus]